jgi:hypothetical protein
LYVNVSQTERLGKVPLKEQFCGIFIGYQVLPKKHGFNTITHTLLLFEAMVSLSQVYFMGVLLLLQLWISNILDFLSPRHYSRKWLNKLSIKQISIHADYGLSPINLVNLLSFNVWFINSIAS